MVLVGGHWRWPRSMQSGSGRSEKRIRSERMIKRLNEVCIVLTWCSFSRLTLFLAAFAEIDWHDYAIVQTIEFTVADANSELPPPMSVQEVENMTLAQKRMAAMVMETTADDVEALRARQAAAEAEAAAAVSSAGVATQGAPVEEDTAMVQSDEEDDLERHMREEEARQTEIERTQLLQASSMSASSGPMKIRTDYVPKREFMFTFSF